MFNYVHVLRERCVITNYLIYYILCDNYLVISKYAKRKAAGSHSQHKSAAEVTEKASGLAS